MSTVDSRAQTISTVPITIRKGSVLVVLSWGSVAWYLSVRPTMTVGELRHLIAKTTGRLFDRRVLGLDLLITGTTIAPDLHISLATLTHSGCRNVCLDVTTGSRPSVGSPTDSIGERLLRKHITEEPFQAGVDQGLWRLIEMNWPRAVFGILSVEGNKRCEVGLRLNFERYPLAGPLVELWDVAAAAAIEAEYWPEYFVRFAIQNYPQFVDLALQPYCPTLLRISTEVACRPKDAARDEWSASGNLTQTLARASCSFRTSQSSRARSFKQTSPGYKRVSAKFRRLACM